MQGLASKHLAPPYMYMSEFCLCCITSAPVDACRHSAFRMPRQFIIGNNRLASTSLQMARGSAGFGTMPSPLVKRQMMQFRVYALAQAPYYLVTSTLSTRFCSIGADAV